MDSKTAQALGSVPSLEPLSSEQCSFITPQIRTAHGARTGDRGGHPWDWHEVARFCRGQARRWTATPVDADDVAQEALLRAWRRRGACQSPDQPWPWLARIVQREAARHHDRRRDVPVEDVDVGAAGGDPADGVDAMTVDRALRDLPARDRALLTLRYAEDLTQPQIAVRLGSPEGTVKVQLHRARGRLRSLLET